MGASFLKRAAFDYAGALITVSSSTDSNSSRFDMLGYENVIFVTTVTDSANTGVATLTIQTSTADSDSAMADSPASATATSATNDDLNDELLIAELKNPLERYVQGTRVSATANIAFGEIFCIRYNSRKPPVSQSSSTVLDADSAVDS